MSRSSSTQRPLTPQMEAVLARLCDRLGGMYKTQAVKLPYLVDVISRHQLGHPIAKGHYQCWNYGVVEPDVYSGIECSPSFSLKEKRYAEDTKWIELTKDNVPNRLSPKEEEIVDYVAATFGKLDHESLGALTKRMNTHIPIDKWGSNATAETGTDAFFKMSEQWKQVCTLIGKLDLSKLDENSKEVTDADLIKLVS